MQKHTRIYMSFFGYKIPEDVRCECCPAMAVDVHHIEARGMGGDPNANADVIENLMALCRKCHEKYGDKIKFLQWLKDIHLGWIQIFLRNKDRYARNPL